MGVAVDGAGNVFVSDTANATIRRITPAGVVTTVAGVLGVSGLADGAAASALFNQPRGLTVDANGNLLVADTGNAVVRKISAAGVVSTLGTATATDTAPAITTQPASVTVKVGAAVVFTAAASGTPTPTYQWRKNGNLISGATSTTYTINSVITGDSGVYAMTATNVAGAVTSEGAVLTIDVSSPTGTASGGGAIGAGFVGVLLLLGMARWMSRNS
jgi:hypothetical protein